MGITFDAFLMICAILLSISYFLFSRLTISSSIFAFLATTIFILSPLFHSLTLIALRQGLSTSFLLLAAIYGFQGRRLLVITCCLAAVATHLSAIFFILAGVTALSVASRGIIFYIFSIAIILLYATGFLSTIFTRLLMPLLTGSSFVGLLAHYNYTVGFKITFLIASAVTLILGWMSAHKNKDEKISILLRFTTIVTFGYMMVSGFPAHDRLAIVSWIMSPIFFSYVIFRIIRVSRAPLANTKPYSAPPYASKSLDD